MFKYRKILLMLSAAALTSTVFTASCIQIKRKDSIKKPKRPAKDINSENDKNPSIPPKDNKDTKPFNEDKNDEKIVKDSKQIETKMFETHLPFIIGQERRGIGIIRNSQQLFDFINNLDYKFLNRNNKKEKQIELQKNLKKLTEKFTSVFNEDFFKNHDLVYQYANSVGANNYNFLDSISIENNKILLNIVRIDYIYHNETHAYLSVLLPWFLNTTFFAVIPKQPENLAIELNPIKTLKKFEEYKPNVDYLKYKKRKSDNFDW